ncbi:enamine deaminase RidA (YjgF/YER057c/UK114 family) [Pseudaminobacter salicylatoxidans]|uniref:Enamine deaminase RidA (YjgF/YER057c/UK114 family) n=1 Tax=Pseudaminobacter salicylatoxidans TaxID=93369 RepID=A0A316C2F1_PSESE|nr:RidA family protein [Pseudaminobacter salicylatoxidans]PWJ83801.1 enamine deaminase RidA (YjgF/YER057c/UK114 family) [Pseudaminobacter salicylatoxidans]
MTTESIHEVLHPANWKAAKGYANGMLADGRVVYLGGQIGWNGDQVFEEKGLVGQTRQTLQNIVDVLKEAGGRPEHIVKLTWYIIDKQDYLANVREIGAAYREVLGKHFPAMAMVQVVALMEDDAKVEIEATAVLPR